MRVKNFLRYIKENLEPGSISDIQDYPTQRTTQELDIDFSKELDNLNNKIGQNQYFLVEKDEYNEMVVQGIYTDIKIFRDDIVEEIMHLEDIEENEIEMDIDFMNEQKYIIVKYLESEDLYRVRIIDVNSFLEAN
jgi:CRISPR/Cas system-associated endonuclease/helicase Cas3